VLVVIRAVQGIEVIPVEHDVSAEIFRFVHCISDGGVVGVLLLKLKGDTHWANGHVQRP
jgi:hypothetical protein